MEQHAWTEKNIMTRHIFFCTMMIFYVYDIYYLQCKITLLDIKFSYHANHKFIDPNNSNNQFYMHVAYYRFHRQFCFGKFAHEHENIFHLIPFFFMSNLEIYLM